MKNIVFIFVFNKNSISIYHLYIHHNYCTYNYNLFFNELQVYSKIFINYSLFLIIIF